jgi:hypothetical protein
MEKKMIKKVFICLFASVFFFAACAPSPVVVEEQAMEIEDAAPETAVEEPVLEEAEAVESSMEEMEEKTEVSFSADVWPIIEKYAVEAHGGKGGVFLESYEDIMEQVVPGDPENSRLYKALIGDGMKQMPPGNPLPDDLINIIYNWIEQGALEN